MFRRKSMWHLHNALVDAGADLVFGHSSYVFRGIEVYKDRPILYGAGELRGRLCSRHD